MTSDGLLRILDEASRAAADLGHRWIGSEHLLLAILCTESANSQALNACGLDYESVRDAISSLPGAYHRRLPRGATTSGSMLIHQPEAQRIRARAEGLAVGLGSTEVREEHVLLSLLWEQGSLALRLIDKLGATRKQIRAELERRGVRVPEVPMPKNPTWGSSFYVSREEFERLTADFRRRGVLYRFNYKGDRVVLSVEDQGEG